ncbi:cytochrome oxidase complex assembly protein 1-domain-containing protein [Colletotrichum godetiae]|uniref:Cytochrome oxidase complex assembly protein 1-domain-containing protein n=1 Tax=Colletotrichum godetiae TaxID=1209918 RepID=A0AAJ0AQQ4_9PEZI|nr:cytochrome oxidase complex assembly protein 1-domain-containing protein [Colletotrichum godetiae]KAK1688620.1 cytochrome oxidase complex assembly protein 1-domain-containing protein [Colletotrichum godetiae]
MFSKTVTRRFASSLRSAAARQRQQPQQLRAQAQRRWATAAPKPGSGPLMERRADRELPDLNQITFRWSRTLPLFAAAIALSSIAIFNYQKSSSPVIASTLYALRTSPKAREYLGDEVQFKHQIPWIAGEMNQLHGRIDISFSVKGSRNEAVMKFASYRTSHKGLFETTEWSLETPDGRVIDLLDGADPFKGSIPGDDLSDDDLEAVVSAAETRGFRQNIK